MTTISGSFIIFFFTTPMGFIMLLGALIYLEYRLGKNIYQSDPWFDKHIAKRVQTYVTHHLHLIHQARIKITPIYLKPATIGPKQVPVHVHGTKRRYRA